MEYEHRDAADEVYGPGTGPRGPAEAAVGGHRNQGAGTLHIALVKRATGISRLTIQSGTRELGSGETRPPERSRRLGSGRKPLIEQDIAVLADLDALGKPTERDDPESRLRWTVKSVRALAVALQTPG